MIDPRVMHLMARTMSDPRAPQAMFNIMHVVSRLDGLNELPRMKSPVKKKNIPRFYVSKQCSRSSSLTAIVRLDVISDWRTGKYIDEEHDHHLRLMNALSMSSTFRAAKEFSEPHGARNVDLGSIYGEHTPPINSRKSSAQLGFNHLPCCFKHVLEPRSRQLGTGV